MTVIRKRLPFEIFDVVFRYVLECAQEHGLLKSKSVAVDATFLEANAAMKSTDGRTHLAYKAEHAVDLDTDLVVAASVYRADHSDYESLANTLDDVNEHLTVVDEEIAIEEAVLDSRMFMVQSPRRLAATQREFPLEKPPHLRDHASWRNRQRPSWARGDFYEQMGLARVDASLGRFGRGTQDQVSGKHMVRQCR
jgi:hypothetical protein